MTTYREPAADLAGTVLEGAYRLVRLIGRGGMGVVYEAVQLRLNKRVAVKLMGCEQASNQTALARFYREAEITSQLGHPHLVNVIDFGAAETGEPYLVMEYLEGEDLEHRIARQGRVAVESAVHIVRQAASALAAAHARDIVHRDLKPANIFLLAATGEPDFVKVLDFGISKVKAASVRLTRAQAVIGTPNYMSPEQATGKVENTDHRADQWALACITWEMLTGATPFVAEDPTALLYQIIHKDPPPLAPLVPHLRPGVEDVLRQALSKRFSDRFATIREFSHAFEAAALNRPADITLIPVPPSTSSALGLGRVPGANDTAVSIATATQIEGELPPGSLDPRALDVAPRTTLSRKTGEANGIFSGIWFKPRRLLAGVAVLSVVAMSLILFLRADTTSLPAAANPPPTEATLPAEASVPAAQPVPPSQPVPVAQPVPAAQPVQNPEVESPARGRPFKAKATSKPKTNRSSDPASKSEGDEGPQGPPKRRLIRKL